MKWRRIVRHNLPTWKADTGPFRCAIFKVKPVDSRYYYEVVVNGKEVRLAENANHVLYNGQRYPKVLKQAKAMVNLHVDDECHKILEDIGYTFF